MTDWFDGYEDLLSEQSDNARDFDLGSENWLKGRTLLTAVESLKIAIDYVNDHAGNYTDEGELLQYLMSRKSVHHFESCFVLLRHGLYNPSRTQIRFLLEMYLLLKGLNRDKKQAARIYDETREQLHNMGSEPLTGTRLRTINEFDSIVKSERDVLEEDEYQLLWQHTSNSAVHPYSLESIEIDNEYSESIEQSLLDAVNVFAFGIAAQFLKAWSGTPVYWDLLKLIDPMIVRIRTSAIGAPPPLFDEDLDLWFPELSDWQLRLVQNRR